jgi:hypothetical protein
MTATTDRDKAENLWQMLNATLISNTKDAISQLQAREIKDCLKANRPNSKETQIDQDKQFAKLVYNELPLSSDVPLVNRLITMCKGRLNIVD